MFVHVFSLCKWIAIRLWSIQTLAAVQSGTPVLPVIGSLSKAKPSLVNQYGTVSASNEMALGP
jgi:hypothetical protein